MTLPDWAQPTKQDTPPMTWVRARKSFPRGGTVFVIGEKLPIDARDVAALVAAGLVEVVEQPVRLAQLGRTRLG